MTGPHRGAPSEARLRAVFDELLRPTVAYRIERVANPYRGSFASESLHLHFEDGRREAYFVKYGVPGVHTGHGFWGGVEREAWIYRNVLPTADLPAPRFVGVREIPDRNETWLVLEHLADARPLDRTSRRDVPGALEAAVRWLARFHAATEGGVVAPGAASLPVYDRGYFLGWLRRTRRFVRPLFRSQPWLDATLARLEPLLAPLADGRPCVVHGEFYPGNVLLDGDVVRPVDWQSAAVGRGELDLASLLEGWGPFDPRGRLVTDYARLRWPSGAPDDFVTVLLRARLYWPLRWLGDDPYWTLHASRRTHLETLRSAAAALGVVATEGAPA